MTQKKLRGPNVCLKIEKMQKIYRKNVNFWLGQNHAHSVVLFLEPKIPKKLDPGTNITNMDHKMKLDNKCVVRKAYRFSLQLCDHYVINIFSLINEKLLWYTDYINAPISSQTQAIQPSC